MADFTQQKGADGSAELLKSMGLGQMSVQQTAPAVDPDPEPDPNASGDPSPDDANAGTGEEGTDNNNDNNDGESTTTDSGSGEREAKADAGSVGSEETNDGDQSQASSEGDQEGSEGAPLLEAILERTGLEANERYTNDTDGLFAAIDDASQTQAQLMVQQMFTQYPVMGELYKHMVEDGMSIDSFLKERERPDWKKFNIEEETGQEQMTRYALAQMGNDSDAVDALVEMYKNKGVLEEKAKSFFANADAADKKAIEQQKQQEKEQAQQMRQQQEEIAKQAEQLLNKGEIMGVTIPKKEQNEFRAFLYGHDDQGVSLAAKKFSEISLDKQMLINWILYKDFQVKGIATKAGQKATLDDMMKQNAKRSTTGKVKEESKKGGVNKKPTVPSQQNFANFKVQGRAN